MWRIGEVLPRTRLQTLSASGCDCRSRTALRSRAALARNGLSIRPTALRRSSCPAWRGLAAVRISFLPPRSEKRQLVCLLRYHLHESKSLLARGTPQCPRRRAEMAAGFRKSPSSSPIVVSRYPECQALHVSWFTQTLTAK